MFDIPNLRIYVSGYGENSDEVYDFIYEEDDERINSDTIDELSEATNEEEFNKKYSAYLEERFYGLDISHPEVVDYLDKEFEKEIEKNPAFQYSQIKMKFLKNASN